MSSRLAVALGLIIGAALVIAAAVAIVLMTPSQSRRIPATPSPAAPSASAGVSASPPPSGGSPAPSGASPGTAATGSGGVPGAPGVPASSAGAGSPTPAPAAFHVGQPAPSLSLPQIGGGTADLAALRGRPVWVYFMATWCPSCQEEFPAMNGFAARYGKHGLVVLAVDVRENEAAAAAFATRMAAIFPVALDGDGTTAMTWGVIGLPVHFWIDAQGIVRDGALGGIGGDVMAAGLRTIMPGVAVSP